MPPKKFFTRTKIEFFIFFIITLFIATRGYVSYASYQSFAINKEAEFEASLNHHDIVVVKSATTTIPILLYHKIGQAKAPSIHGNKVTPKYSVDTDVFDAQMKFIKDSGYTTLTTQELINDEQNHNLPAKPLVITFDDGWKSQYENALPILNKYNMHATFYIYTGVIGSPLYMSWDDLHSLLNQNMEIGDHTKTHSRLSKINADRLDEEISKSKNVLENNLHVTISDFAFPYGDYNKSVLDVVKKSGYVSARTSNQSIYNDFHDLYQLNSLYAPNSLKRLEEKLGK